MQKSRFFKDTLLEVNKELATVIGLKESIVLGEIIKHKELNVFYVNIGNIIENELNFLDSSTVRRIVKSLQEQKLIKKVDTNRENIIEKLKEKPSVNGVGSKKCVLCKSSTAQLHYHHYPLKASEGGIETIGICPNCHFEYHYMEFNYEINFCNINNMIAKGGN